MTFNRYILFRMVVEFVGAIACAIQMFQHHTWPGIITMGVFALVWAIGEIWLVEKCSCISDLSEKLSRFGWRWNR